MRITKTAFTCPESFICVCDTKQLEVCMYRYCKHKHDNEWTWLTMTDMPGR